MMKSTTVLLAAVLALVIVAPLNSMVEWNYSWMNFEFENNGEKFPKKVEMIVPITRTIKGRDGGPLSIEVEWGHNFYEDDNDPRRNKGKLTAVVKIYRDDNVIWDITMKGKVQDGVSMGLFACDAVDLVLEKGDLVVATIKLKSLPKFNTGEQVYMYTSVEPYLPEWLLEDTDYCKY